MRDVATFATPDEAHLAVSRLESAGIRAVIPDDLTLSQNYAFANALGGVRVQVAEEDLADSRSILGMASVAEGILHCPHCQSSDVRVRPLGPLAGLALGLGLAAFPREVTADCRACGRSFTTPRTSRGG